MTGRAGRATAVVLAGAVAAATAGALFAATAGAGSDAAPEPGRTLSVAKLVPKRFAPKQGTRISLTGSKQVIVRQPRADLFERANLPSRSAVTGEVKKTAFKATLDVADFPRRVIRRTPRPLPKLTLRKPSSAGGRAGSTDLVLFRNQEISSTALTGTTGEPSVGNDRNSILFTGNWYTAFSGDNGLNWGSLDPVGLDDADGSGSVTASEQTDGGFCCDQVVNASDVDGHEVIAWLLQYTDDGNQNTIRVATFDGRSDLLGQTGATTTGSPIKPCFYDFRPKDFGFGSKVQFDFNTMENTDKFLYVATNVFTIPTGKEDAKSMGSIVWRMSLDDLADGNCRLDEGGLFFSDSNDQSPRLVNGAGSTMFWASPADSHLALHIYEWPDGSSEVTQTNKGTSFYHGGSFLCLKGAVNPCAHDDTRITAGWLGNGEVGWLWGAAQAGKYPFPYVQGARFKTSDLSLIDEPVIWNENYAWTYPSAGVNARGDVGVILYRLGGSENPRPRAFVVDDVSGWDSITTVGIATSSATPSDPRWGDYGRVAAYDGCSNTWIGSAYTAASATTQKPVFVWFGRERDGCADLVVSLFGFLYSSTSNLLTLADTTWNTGGVTAAASTTRFYLSRDTEVDSGDTLLDVKHEVPALDAGDSNATLLFTSVPGTVKAGTYHVIACADQPEAVAEVSNSNNCLVEADTLTVPLTFRPKAPGAAITGPKQPAATVTRPGKLVPRPTRTETLPAITTLPGRTNPPPARTVAAPVRTTPTLPGRTTTSGRTTRPTVTTLPRSPQRPGGATTAQG